MAYPDYAFRATLPRTQAATAIVDAVKAIGYLNFKDTVSEHDRHRTPMRRCGSPCANSRKRGHVP